MMKKGIKAKVIGKVQGVWFRKHTKQKADELGLKGFVRNEPDGSVYVEAEGDLYALRIFREWLHIGSPQSIVENVEIEEMPYKGYEDFRIL